MRFTPYLNHGVLCLYLLVSSLAAIASAQHHTTGPAKPTASWGCREGCQECGGLTCWEWCPPQLPVADCYRDDPDRPCLLCYRAGGNYCGPVYVGDEDGNPQDVEFCCRCAQECVCVIGGICLDDEEGGGSSTQPPPTPAPTLIPAIRGWAEPRDAFDGRGAM